MIFALTPATLLAAILIFSTSCTKSSSPKGNEVVVRVNSRELTAKDLSQELAKRLREFNALMARDSNIVSIAKNSIIQDFIVRAITEDWAKEKEIFVRKEALDSAIDRVRSSYSDDLAFRKTLASEGLAYDEWVERLKQTLLGQLVADEVRKTIPKPSAEDIKKFYANNKTRFQQATAVKIRQVVLPSKHQAEMVLAEVRRGRSLSELAKNYSTAPEGKDGGVVGWVKKGDLGVFDHAFNLNGAQKSGVIESAYGFHIMEVIERRTNRVIPFEEVKGKIEQELLAKAEQDYYSRWLEKQLLAAKVFKNDAVINSISVYSRGN